MEFITIGKTTFKANTLTQMTKKEAQGLFVNVDKNVISLAWNMANPKGKRKPRK
tara:strand:+ start:11327 stop:11488 length:162 start_codon:yes stop_codon:yes gene_type:complete